MAATAGTTTMGPANPIEILKPRLTLGCQWDDFRKDEGERSKKRDGPAVSPWSWSVREATRSKRSCGRPVGRYGWMAPKRAMLLSAGVFTTGSVMA